MTLLFSNKQKDHSSVYFLTEIPYRVQQKQINKHYNSKVMTSDFSHNNQNQYSES